MPKKYDREKAGMFKRRFSRSKISTIVSWGGSAKEASSVEIFNEMIERNDPSLENSLGIRELYAGQNST